MTNDDYREDTGNHREIPEEVQDISTEELTANDYDVVPSDYQSGDDIEPQNAYVQEPPADFEPGRTRNDDSIDASSENLGGTRTGRDYSAGHEMSAATNVGKPDERGSYDEKLHRINDGRHQTDGTLSHRQSDWDKKRITQAICSDLPISKRQRETVVAIMEGLDLDRFGHQKAIERVCLGVVAVIVNDTRVRLASDPEEVTLITWEDEFQDIAAKYDVSMSDLSTIKQTVRDELDDMSPEPSNEGVKRDLDLPKVTPSERPDEYWEHRSSQYWVSLAYTWERRDDDIKDALPADKRERVNLLRKWKPWEREDNSETKRQDDEAGPELGSASTTERETATDSDLGDLDSSIEDEAEALVASLEADDE